MSNNICRAENCSNSCAVDSYYCEQVHGEQKRQSEDKSSLSLKSDWPPGVIFGRPYYMKVFFEKADQKIAAMLTGLPQLPDPNANTASMPAFYENQLRALEAKADTLSPEEKLDLRILKAIKQRYLNPKRDMDELKKRQGVVNDHYYSRRVGGRGRNN